MTRKNGRLPQLQNRIVKLFSTEGPLTRNEIANRLKASYKPVLYATNSLSGKGLIQVVNQKERCGRLFPRYWLSFEGIFTAFLQGINSKSLLKHAKVCYPEDYDGYSLLIELFEAVDERVLESTFRLFLRKEKVEPLDVFYLVLQGITVNKSKIKEIKGILVKYPKYARIFRESIKEVSSKIEELKGISHE